MPKREEKLRGKMNISQEQLARELHVSFATVNRWENVKNSPNMLAMKELNDLCKEKGLEEALIEQLLDYDIKDR